MIPATPAHAAAMALIHAAAFSPGQRWGADAFALQLALPGVYGFIDPAGGMILARLTADEAEILTLAVDPVLQRQGRATALLQAAMQAAKGARSMVLEVAATNAPARALYARAGFAQVGLRPGYYAGTDAFILRASLS